MSGMLVPVGYQQNGTHLRGRF